ncbi:C6 and c2h2 transcription factor [Lasiodiplodia theobromae]|uniref:C6 and c2h2 transcription factor n=1 Tax=Lasiodiplodia theobromae TaxID=45133 RepID=UPI0015C3C28D|nr:C6 and c2h2 transcription factor [Lasiodiplodia theobromae]KAF4542819.1 C6 and c2h2 transcription factor [Lasiodiplodia theobromae]
MGGIVIMLSQIDGKRLDKWNFFFQPNAIVSTFVVVAKTTMLVAVSESLNQLKWLYFSGGRRSLGDFEAFDGASRGPWGALSFFWRMRLKVPFALVGSVVMILSLAMGPFAQQIISFPVRYVQSVHEVAAINVTSHFTRAAYKQEKIGLAAALYDGLFNKSTPLDFVCPSANCTWDLFYTLGLCNECNAITLNGEIQPGFVVEDVPLIPERDNFEYTEEMYPLAMTTPFDTQSFSIGCDDEQNAADILSDGLTFNWTSAVAAILSNLSAMIFSNNTNASGVFDDIVACMTDSLWHSTNSTIAKGHTLRPVALIQVSWIWIILPISLVLLSAIFFGWTLWYNSHYRAPL